MESPKTGQSATKTSNLTMTPTIWRWALLEFWAIQPIPFTHLAFRHFLWAKQGELPLRRSTSWDGIGGSAIWASFPVLMMAGQLVISAAKDGTDVDPKLELAQM